MDNQELIEISVCGLDDEANSMVIQLFDTWGLGGSVVEQTVDAYGVVQSAVKAYLPTEQPDLLRQIEIGLALLDKARDSEGKPCLPPLVVNLLAETDWAEAWKANYHPLRIGRHIVIKPSWHDYEPRPNDLVIEMDPGMAFGSGLHSTTRLCLQALEDNVKPGVSVLDVGTGSGILSLAAAKLGASLVLGLDSDALAVRVADQNVILNGLDSVIDLLAGRLDMTGKGDVVITSEPPQSGDQPAGQTSILQEAGWDLVVVNILAEVIIDMAPALSACLAADGVLIASGIISDRKAAVEASLYQSGLQPVEEQVEGEWVALVARRR